MKYTKKLLSLAMVVILALAMAVPSFAAGTNYTLTINDATEGHTYEAYQVFAGDYDGGMDNLSNVQWGSGVNGDALLAALKADEKLSATFADCTTAADVAAKLQQSNVKAFADIVADNLTTTKASLTYVAAIEGGAAAHYSATLAEGYYFVKQVGTVGENEAFSDYIVELLDDVSVEPKANDVPTVDKTIAVDNPTIVGSYSFGDIIPFKLTATLPDADTLAEYETYYVTFNDTMTGGLSYNGDAVVKMDGNAITQGVTITPGGKTLTVRIDDVIALGAQGGEKITVDYTATLVAEGAQYGITANMNEVTLNFSNDPNNDSEGTTPKDEVYIYTFKMNGLKYDGANESKVLSGAWFTLQRTTDNKYAVIDVNGNVTGWQAEVPTHPVDGQQVAGNITSDVNGEFKVYGLAIGTYKLNETVAPAGYNLLESAVTIVVKGDLDTTTGAASELSVTVGGEEGTLGNDGVFTAGIENRSGSTLPSTGGMGTTIFYVVGGTLVVAAAVLLITKKRMHNAED